jgi:microsomal dipeptidase-like Zn-dependent dipeptidase
LAALTHELLKQGLDEPTLRKVMGGNAKRYFAENLPE